MQNSEILMCLEKLVLVFTVEKALECLFIRRQQCTMITLFHVFAGRFLVKVLRTAVCLHNNASV
jgi:hypothetical protein